MNILVTGSTGFIGRHAIELLRRQGIKHCQLNRHGVASPGVSLGDITDPAFVRAVVAKEQPTHCIHLAAAGLHEKDADPDKTMRVNIGGTKNILEAVRDVSPTTVVVLVGSSAEYGLRATTEKISERGRLQPESAYGRSKVECFRLFQRFGQHDRLQLLYCRPFNVIGPEAHESHPVSRQIRFELAGQPDPTFLLQNQRDYIDVRDVADALLAICKGGKTGECYNICTGRGIPGAHLLATIRTVLGKTQKISQALQAPTAQRSPRHQVGDNDKIRRSLRWHPAYLFERSVLDQVRTVQSQLSTSTNGN